MRYFIVTVLLATCFVRVEALYISEIMYDPAGADTGREWIEVYNDTASSVNLTTWKFLEGGTNHGISSYSGGDVIPANKYAIIADNPVKFLADFPSYNGVLYDSAFSLINSGEELVLKNNTGDIIDTVNYDTSIGGSNDGTTLSKINGLWIKGDATPGEENKLSTIVVDTSGTGGGVSTTTSNQSVVAQMSPPTADIVIYVPVERTVITGAQSAFNVYSMTRGGKVIENVKYTWAFGDGGRGLGATTTHTFAYPGRYLLYVSGSNGYIKGEARTLIHVVPADISIIGYGAGKYGNYVDIQNPNSYEIDMSQWKLMINGSGFPFPERTTLLPKSTTRFSGIAMGFASTTITDYSLIKITFPNQEEVTRYTAVLNKGNVEEKLSTTNTNIYAEANVPNASPQVLGVSTTTVPSVAKPIVKKVVKPIVISKPKIVPLASASTLEIATATATTTSSLSQKSTSSVSTTTSTTKKDTRIIAFLKYLFGW